MERRRNRLPVTAFTLMAVLLLVAPSFGGCALAPEQTRASASGTEAQAPVEPTSATRLLIDLVEAYESPSADSAQLIASDLDALQADDPGNYEVALAAANQWETVYLNPSYQLLSYGGEGWAPELMQTELMDSPTHAFVVLGYALEDGEMADELRGRCEAAAAAARTYPHSILICTGGATGANNPEHHTEAGLMRSYLVDACGIEATRVHVDEKATTTRENALHTLEIMQQNGLTTLTLVTSSYHQRWAQVVYRAVAAAYQQKTGYGVELVSNYNYAIEPSAKVYRQDDRIAALQIAELLGISQDQAQLLPPVTASTTASAPLE